MWISNFECSISNLWLFVMLNAVKHLLNAVKHLLNKPPVATNQGERGEILPSSG